MRPSRVRISLPLQETPLYIYMKLTGVVHMASRFVITVLGEDKVGIVASITRCLADNNANIVDISQTVLQDLFSMIMLVSVEKTETDLPKLRCALEAAGLTLGVKVMLQHEDVFRYMHRV